MPIIMISGSQSISVLPVVAIKYLNRIMEYGIDVVIGDCFGVDREVQHYFRLNDYNQVTVYYALFDGSGKPRNCDSYPCVGIPGSYRDRDKALCRVANAGIAIWNGKSKGTASNIKAVPRTKVIMVGTDEYSQIKVVNKKGLCLPANYVEIPIDRNTIFGNCFRVTKYVTRSMALFKYKQSVEAYLLDSASPFYKEIMKVVEMYKKGTNIYLTYYMPQNLLLHECYGEYLKSLIIRLASRKS